MAAACLNDEKNITKRITKLKERYDHITLQIVELRDKQYIINEEINELIA